MGFNVDTNNRSLHSSERKTAIALAKASDGRYSEEEIVAQLRQMPNMLLATAGDKDAATGAPEMYANMQDPATQARWQQERKDDPNMQVNVSGVSMMERQSPANGELQAFIVSATTFPSGPLAGRSPYVLTPAAASQILNQAAAEQRANAPAQPRHHNCASTECLLMGANYNPNNPQNRAEMERREGALKAAGVIITGPALLAAAATPAGQAALQTLLWNKAAATGAAAGGGANAAVQYATTGKVDPVGVVVGVGTGALGGGALNTLTTARNVGPMVAQAGGLTAAVGINAAGAAVTNGEQGATAGGSVVGYGVGLLPIPGAPYWGAFAQEALTSWLSQQPKSVDDDRPNRGGQ
jgi:filamentous hemagglutinin